MPRSWAETKGARTALVGALVLAGCGGSSLKPDGQAAGDVPEEQPVDSGAADLAEQPVDGGLADLAAAPDGDHAHCGARTSLRAQITVRRPDGTSMACGSPQDGGIAFGVPPAPEEWSGDVTGSDTTSVDVCPNRPESLDAGACATATLHVVVAAPGLDLSRFPLGRVHVRASIAQSYECLQSLAITAYAASSDASSNETLILSVDDGGGGLAGPYAVDHVQLGCAPGPTCNGNATGADDYALDFRDVAGGGPPLRVYMGESKAWTVAGAPVTVRNVRSFQTGVCDDYWNWAYTIYADPK